MPVVYFLYPETAYRSLEEMDNIFRKTTGWFDVVKSAKEEPHWHDKNGEPILNYEDTIAYRGRSVLSAKAGVTAVENTEQASPSSAAEKGIVRTRGNETE